MSIQRRIYEKLAGLDTKKKNIEDAKSDARKKMDDEMESRKESFELEEGPAHQNPRITAFGGMKAAQNTPSYKRYQARLKAEREARKREFERDQAAKKGTREEVDHTDEAIKYDSAGDSTGTVTGKGKRDRGAGGEVKVTYKGSDTYKDGAKLPIKARDIGRLLRQARRKGTTPYDSRNLKNPRLTKDHVEYDDVSIEEMNYLGKDKKFGRKFYEKDGQLHVVVRDGKPQNLGSTEVKSNQKMMKKLVKDEVELDELKMPKTNKYGEYKSRKVRDATLAGSRRASAAAKKQDNKDYVAYLSGKKPDTSKARRHNDRSINRLNRLVNTKARDAEQREKDRATAEKGREKVGAGKRRR